MIYDFIAVVNFSLCIYSIYVILVILSRSRRKVYFPPEIRKRYIYKLVGFLAIPSVSTGAIFRVVTFGMHKDPLFAIFATIACIAMLVTALQSLSIFKEPDISIKDALSEDTDSN